MLQASPTYLPVVNFALIERSIQSNSTMQGLVTLLITFLWWSFGLAEFFVIGNLLDRYANNGRTRQSIPWTIHRISLVWCSLLQEWTLNTLSVMAWSVYGCLSLIVGYIMIFGGLWLAFWISIAWGLGDHNEVWLVFAGIPHLVVTMITNLIKLTSFIC